jgi:sarcosine oxidase subunit gamma
MLEVRPALNGHLRSGRFGAESADPPVTLSECPTGMLVQIAGWRDAFEATATPLMLRLGFAGIGDFASAQTAGEATAFRIAPERVLLRLPSPDAWRSVASSIDQAVTPTLDLSHARTIVRVSGPEAPNLLARLLPIDVDDEAFGPDRFAQSGLHSVAVLVHRRRHAGPRFDLYIPSSYAVSVWELIADTAAPFGYRVNAS